MFIRLIILVLTISSGNPLFGQTFKHGTSNMNTGMYFDLYYGTQVSGIRKEDYVTSNFAPYLQLSAGKWLSKNIALSLSYQGPYFHFIGDSHKHKYAFISSDVNLDINRFFTKENSGIWHINVFTGIGALFNNFYTKTNICINAGLINELKILKHLSLKVKVSGIIGHSIYQKDKDILPNVSLGLSKIIRLSNSNNKNL